jgi:putative transposase
MKEIAATRVRYGHRRIHVLVRREGWPLNAKRLYRSTARDRPAIPQQTLRRRVKAKLRNDRIAVTRSNEIWAMDFVRAQLATRSDACGF